MTRRLKHFNRPLCTHSVLYIPKSWGRVYKYMHARAIVLTQSRTVQKGGSNPKPPANHIQFVNPHLHPHLFVTEQKTLLVKMYTVTTLTKTVGALNDN